MKVEQLYKERDIQVTFKENEDTAFYCIKDGEPYYLAVDILVFKNGEKISQYFRNFEKEVNTMHYDRFVQKFLEDKEYREQYLVEGEVNWEGMIAFQENTGVNKKCKHNIERINKRSKLNFRDFAELRTFGIDSFSRKKYEDLLEILSGEIVQKIEKELKDEKLRLTALRWAARGLYYQHAIRKVKTDEEIKNNMNRSKAK